jgi:hypothetical protein
MSDQVNTNDKNAAAHNDDDEDTREMRKRELETRIEANVQQVKFHAASCRSLWIPSWFINLVAACAAVGTVIYAAKNVTAQLSRNADIRAQSLHEEEQRREREDAAAERDSFLSTDFLVEQAQALGNNEYWLDGHLGLKNVSKRPNRPLVIFWSVWAPPTRGSDDPQKLDSWNFLGNGEFSEIYPGQSVEYAGRTKIKTTAPAVLMRVEAYFVKGSVTIKGHEAECGFDETPPAGKTMAAHISSMNDRPKVCLRGADSTCIADKGCISWSAERMVSLRGSNATKM